MQKKKAFIILFPLIIKYIFNPPPFIFFLVINTNMQKLLDPFFVYYHQFIILNVQIYGIVK